MKVFRRIVDQWQGMNLVLRISVGIILGVLLAVFFPELSGIAILGDLFVGALKAIAPLLVGVLVVASVAKARNGLGRRFRTIIILYLFTTFVAAVLAVFASRLFPVGIIVHGVSEL